MAGVAQDKHVLTWFLRPREVPMSGPAGTAMFHVKRGALGSGSVVLGQIDDPLMRCSPGVPTGPTYAFRPSEGG